MFFGIIGEALLWVWFGALAWALYRLVRSLEDAADQRERQHHNP